MKKKTNARHSPERHTSKKRYRIRNWSQYNAALRQRGSLTLWVDEAAVSGWRNEEKTGRRGASRTYSDGAVLCSLTVQAVYHLPLRATIGLMESLFKWMQLELPLPDPSTLCRRRQDLPVGLLASLPRGALHMVVDASGFKVFGEGEWKVRQHGYSKRRTWRKLHLGVNEASGEILAATVSTNDFRDDEVLGDLLPQVPEEMNLSQVSGDGIFDSRECYRLLQERDALASFPPRHGARLSKKPELSQRNANIERIAQLSRNRQDGRKRWKEEIGYHRRSLAETTFFRVKTIFGNHLTARGFDAQASELLLRCSILNRMTQQGMPQSYAV